MEEAPSDTDTETDISDVTHVTISPYNKVFYLITVLFRYYQLQYQFQLLLVYHISVEVLLDVKCFVLSFYFLIYSLPNLPIRILGKIDERTE
jgi:hypothetical protein